jgi:ribosomal protein S18 acetylase RimI-like enzyme
MLRPVAADRAFPIRVLLLNHLNSVCLDPMASPSAEKIELMPAVPDDFDMALNLYLSSMEPLTAALMTWDENKQTAGFREQWNLKDVQIITLDGRTIGWVQTAELATEIFLQQLFVSHEYQGRGVGSRVLEALLQRWERTGKPVVLMVLKNNPARRLYERHGLAVVGEIGVKLQMRRNFR